VYVVLVLKLTNLFPCARANIEILQPRESDAWLGSTVDEADWLIPFEVTARNLRIPLATSCHSEEINSRGTRPFHTRDGQREAPEHCHCTSVPTSESFLHVTLPLLTPVPQ